jgi:hypothetical protein
MTRRTGWLMAVAAALTALAVSYCGSSYSPTGPGGGGTPTPTPMSTPGSGGGSDQVMISGFAFGALTVPVNTTVTWRNADSVVHTATSDAGSAFKFDTGNIAPGATSAGILFNQVGTFPYHCTVHPDMHATIVVQ